MQNFYIDKIIASLKSTYGKHFLDTITMQLHKAIGAKYTFIARLDKERFVSKTISIVSDDEFLENFEYSLENTPCADVKKDSSCIYPHGICNLYPQDDLLIEMAIEGYVGSSLFDSSGETIGLVVALYGSKIENSKEVAALFELFSGRISAELERSDKEKELNELNQLLEQKVSYRTHEIEAALKQLKDSQSKLIEQEKLASLGRLVAGVAHEVNTPIGVAVLGNSIVLSNIEDIETKLNQQTLQRKDLNNFIATVKEASQGVEFNLSRSSELIADFKQMSTDLHGDEKREVDLTKLIKTTTTSLNPMLKKSNIRLRLELPEQRLLVTTYLSRVVQVVTNLVSNAERHAFPKSFYVEEKVITVSLSGNSSNYSLSIADNGVGMTEAIKSHVLEPFYTSDRANGGMGLGMSIVHNLVTSSLDGKLVIDSEEGNGTTIDIQFDSSKSDIYSLKNSFNRAIIDNYQFYSTFHEKLVNSNIVIKRLFKNVNLERQQNMVFQSIALFIDNSDNVEALFEGGEFKKLVDLHRHMNINSELLTIWKDCFVDTVAVFDHEFNDKLSDAWHNKGF